VGAAATVPGLLACMAGVEAADRLPVPARIVKFVSDKDQAALYSLAANCSLYEEDPQPARMNIGSAAEPMMVTAAEGWRDFYARHLLVQRGRRRRAGGRRVRVGAAGATEGAGVRARVPCFRPERVGDRGGAV
jgi:hypothetical protein